MPSIASSTRSVGTPNPAASRARTASPRRQGPAGTISARSEAMLTRASATPGTMRRTFSARWTQAEQVMPEIGRDIAATAMGRS